MAKRIRASDILQAHKKRQGTNPLLLIQRLNVIENRKRDREARKSRAWSETQGLVSTLETAGLKHRIAKAGGFEGNLLSFLFGNPTENQSYFEAGQKEVRDNPLALEPSLIEKFGQNVVTGIQETIFPALSKGFDYGGSSKLGDRGIMSDAEFEDLDTLEDIE